MGKMMKEGWDKQKKSMRTGRGKMFIPFLDCVSLLMGWAVQLSNVLRGKGNRNTIEQRALHSMLLHHASSNTKQKIRVQN